MTARKDWFGTVTGDVAFDPTLSPAAKAVYLVLCMYRNREDDTCYPSNETLMKHTGLSETTMKRVINELVRAFIIRRTPRFKDGRQTTSLTTLTDSVALRGVSFMDPRGSADGPPGGAAGGPQNTPTMNTEVSTVESKSTELDDAEGTA